MAVDLNLKFVEDVTGRTIALAGGEFEPLPYTELVNTKLKGSLVVKLVLRNSLIVHSEMQELDQGEIGTVETRLTTPYSSNAVGLLPGGWLPAGLAVKGNITVLPDRNTISFLRGRFHTGQKVKDDDLDFLDFFSEPGLRINPALVVIEGNQRKNPSFEMIQQQVIEVMAQMRKALPQAVMPQLDTPQALKGLYAIVQESQAAMGRNARFLQSIRPKLLPNTSKAKREELWTDVLGAADASGVPQRSLVVMAVLSAISAPMATNPAKRILKLDNTKEVPFGDESIYNALSDLRALELFIQMMSQAEEKIMLCTGDKNLALFWVGLRPRDIRSHGGVLTVSFAPEKALFENAPPELLRAYFNG